MYLYPPLPVDGHLMYCNAEWRFSCLQGPDPESRKAVESKNPFVSVARGHVRLDDDPDVKEACAAPIASPITSVPDGCDKSRSPDP